MLKNRYLLFVMFVLVVSVVVSRAASAFSLVEGVHSGCMQEGDCNVCDATRVIYNVGRFIFISMAGVALIVAIYAALNLILIFIDWNRLQIIKSILTHTLVGLGIIMAAWMVVYLIMFGMLKVRQDKEIWTAGSWYAGPACERTGGGIVTPAPPAPDKIVDGCAGISPVNIKPGQCNDASPALTTLLKCIKDNKDMYATLVDKTLLITSVSDDDGFLYCRDHYTKPKCDHTRGSCHYGGPFKSDSSYAADFRSWGYDNKDQLAFKALVMTICKGYYLWETDHIHISSRDCGGL